MVTPVESSRENKKNYKYKTYRLKPTNDHEFNDRLLILHCDHITNMGYILIIPSINLILYISQKLGEDWGLVNL